MPETSSLSLPGPRRRRSQGIWRVRSPCSWNTPVRWQPPCSNQDGPCSIQRLEGPGTGLTHPRSSASSCSFFSSAQTNRRLIFFQHNFSLFKRATDWLQLSSSTCGYWGKIVNATSCCDDTPRPFWPLFRPHRLNQWTMNRTRLDVS